MAKHKSEKSNKNSESNSGRGSAHKMPMQPMMTQKVMAVRMKKM